MDQLNTKYLVTVVDTLLKREWEDKDIPRQLEHIRMLLEGVSSGSFDLDKKQEEAVVGGIRGKLLDIIVKI
jgi:hypothetical protein